MRGGGQIEPTDYNSENLDYPFVHCRLVGCIFSLVMIACRIGRGTSRRVVRDLDRPYFFLFLPCSPLLLAYVYAFPVLTRLLVRIFLVRPAERTPPPPPSKS